MRTPDGSDCSYYYEDFHRGRNVQECRATKAEGSAPWRLTDCAKCPVPRILLANASPNLHVILEIKSKWLGFGRSLNVTAFCKRHEIPIADPYVGCEQCNRERPGLDLFKNALNELDE